MQGSVKLGEFLSAGRSVCLHVCKAKSLFGNSEQPIRICNLKKHNGGKQKERGHETLTLNHTAPCRHKDYPSAQF